MRRTYRFYYRFNLRYHQFFLKWLSIQSNEFKNVLFFRTLRSFILRVTFFNVIVLRDMCRYEIWFHICVWNIVSHCYPYLCQLSLTGIFRFSLSVLIFLKRILKPPNLFRNLKTHSSIHYLVLKVLKRNKVSLLSSLLLLPDFINICLWTFCSLTSVFCSLVWWR